MKKYRNNYKKLAQPRQSDEKDHEKLKKQNIFYIEDRESFESLCERKAAEIEFAMNGYIRIYDKKDNELTNNP